MLNGKDYDKVRKDSGSDVPSVRELRACIMGIPEATGIPLLRAGCEPTRADGSVMLAAASGAASLSAVHVTTSCEALLGGKAPPVRVLVWAVDGDGGDPLADIQPLVRGAPGVRLVGSVPRWGWGWEVLDAASGAGGGHAMSATCHAWQ